MLDLYIKQKNGRYKPIGGNLLARIKQHKHGGFDVAVAGDFQSIDPANIAEFITQSLIRQQEWFQEFNEWKAQSVGKIAKGNDQ